MTYRIDCACGTSWQGPELDVVSWAACQHQRACQDVLTLTSGAPPQVGSVVKLVNSDYVLP